MQTVFPLTFCIMPLSKFNYTQQGAYVNTCFLKVGQANQLNYVQRICNMNQSAKYYFGILKQD